MRYLIRYIGPLPAFLFGGLLGLVMSIPPALLLGYTLVALARRLFELIGRLAFVVPLPLNQSLPIDLIELMQLGPWREGISRIAAGGGTMVATIAIVFVLCCGVGGALAGLVGALLFNLIARLTGGIEVTAEAIALDKELTPVGHTPFVPAAVLAATEPASYHPSAGAHTVWLERPGDPKQRWPLSQGVTRIGSAAGNDIVIKDLLPHHAELHYEDLRYYAIPVEGPIQVNDVDVTARHSLRNATRLKLGETELVFHLPSGS